MHGLMAVLFAIAALMLIVIAARTGWNAFVHSLDRAAAQTIIEAIGLLAAVVVALQISETILEEEIVRGADSTPTLTRRFLSRFFVVIVVALGEYPRQRGSASLGSAIGRDPARSGLGIAVRWAPLWRRP